MTEAFLHALEAVFILGCVAGAGYYSAALGWYDEKGKKLVSRIVGLSLPFFLFYSISSKFTHEELVQLIQVSWLPFAAFAVYYLSARLLCRTSLVRAGWKGTFTAMFAGSSIMFVGLPVTLSMYGDKGVPYLLVYFLANVLYVWTLGLYHVQLDGVEKTGRPAPSLFSAQSLKMIFSKPLIGFMLGVLVVALGIAVPRPVSSAAHMIGQIASPLALIFVGITIHQVGFGAFRHLPRETWLVLFSGNVFRPFVMFVLTGLVDMDPLMRQVLVTSSVMPVSPMFGVMAKLYDAPAEFAAETIGTTVAALTFTLPLLMLLISQIR